VLREACVATDSQIRAIELQDEACVMHGLVFYLHHLRQRLEIFLVACVMSIFQKQRDDARRCCRHKRLARLLSGQRGLETLYVLFCRF
jgi:hypothetical protein